ncbi:MAG: site-2 protease family protein [Syntrophothermus sp.]
MDLGTIIYYTFYIFAFLFALSLHEFSHGAVANLFGDPTARYAGRLTLNPLAHLDPLGTLAFIISATQRVGFGWAKPVPVDPRYFKDQRRGMMYVGLAGPLSNLTLAIVLTLVLRVFPGFFMGSYWGEIAGEFLALNIWINLTLAVFNLIPLPPLDGSKILAGLLPPRQAYQFLRLEAYGPILLLLFLMSGAGAAFLRPVLTLLGRLLGIS